MPGFQFVHCQQFSRKAISGKPGSDGVTKGGRASVADVLAEAGREPGASLHVDHPAPPLVVHGVDIAGVRLLHDERVEVARTQVEGGKPRKVRVDQATLLTVVASYPATVEECATDPVKARERDEWQARNVEWLRAEFGDDLVSVVRHEDEKFPHLHAFVIPSDPEMKANPLHPGWAAKQAAKAEAGVAGLDLGEANRAGDRAYREAMRAMQDRYWEGVGLPSGLARIGPARRRLDRAGWLDEQAAATAAGTAITAAERATAERREAHAGLKGDAMRACDLVARARAAAAAAVAQADAAEASRAAALAEVARLERRAGTIVGRAKAEARRLVGEARVEADRMRGWGERLGSLWSGLAGVQARLERRAASRVEAVEARAVEAVAAAKVEARGEVSGEVARLREAAEAAVRAAAAAKAEAAIARKAESAARVEVGQERRGRLVAEREREDFRGRWADADNRLRAGTRHGR